MKMKLTPRGEFVRDLVRLVICLVVWSALAIGFVLALGFIVLVMSSFIPGSPVYTR